MWSSREDGNEVIVRHSREYCTERSLTPKASANIDVIVKVLVGARLVPRGNVGQSLEVCEIGVKQVAQRGS